MQSGPGHNWAARQRDERARIERENVLFARRLRDQYKVNGKSFVVANKLGAGVDCRPRFRQRTELYASGGAPGTARILPTRRESAATAVGGAGTRRGAAASSKGVPRTLACAQCAGCGRRAWFAGDGRPMVPCPACGLVYYCSDACREVDALGHERVCQHATGAAKWKATPAPDRAWVTNRAMLVGRRMLRRTGAQNGAEVIAAMRKEAAREAAREESAAREKALRDKGVEVVDAAGGVVDTLK